MNIEIKKSKNPIKYEDAIEFMEQRLRDIDQEKSNDLIWTLQHEDVYTGGTSFDENEILDKSIAPVTSNLFATCH